MPRQPQVPRELSFLPFRGTATISQGLLTRRMLERPTWRRLLPDVYIRASEYRPDDHRMWCDAVALKLPPGAAVAGLSAAFLWGTDLLPRDGVAPVTVVLPGPARLHPHPRIKISYGRLSGPQDVTTFGGLPVTTGVRTAFDLGRQLPRADALVAVDALLLRRVLKRPALVDYLDAHPGWPGNVQLREVLALAEPLSESPMETRLRLLLHDAGLPPTTPQHDVHDAAGRFLGRVDLAYPHWRIAIEYEGDHHRERAHFRWDVARLNALRAAGWLVLRFTADDVLRHPDRVVRQVILAIRERQPTVSVN